jgi:hypothetical protein
LALVPNSSNVVSETSSSPKPSSSNKGASTNVTPCSVVSGQRKIKIGTFPGNYCDPISEN